MVSSSYRQNRLLPVIQFLFIFAWLCKLLCLMETDCYYSAYLFCGVLSVAALVSDKSEVDFRNRTQKLFLFAAGILYALAVLLANYQLFSPFSFSEKFDELCIWLFGSFFVAYTIFKWALKHLPLPAENNHRKHPGRVFLAVFAAVAVMDLAYLFTSANPGVLTLDSMASIREFSTGGYTNINPFWFTVTVELFYKIGYFLFQDANAAVAFYTVVQILLMASCFAYVIVTLYQAGVPSAYLVIAAAAYTFLPYNIAYGSTIWKDIVFGVAALLVATSLYRILCKIGARKGLNYAVLGFGVMGLSLWRTNGWYAMLVTALVFGFAFWRKNRKLLIFLLILVMIGWLLLNPVLDMLGVYPTDMLEAFSIPLQQIARVIYEGNPITVEEEAFLAQMLDLDVVREQYSPTLADPVKWIAFRRDNRDFVREHFMEYAQLWLRLGVRYPTVYLKAWVDQTKGYWNAGYDYWYYAYGITENEFSICQQAIPSGIAQGWRSYFDAFCKETVLQPFVSIGLHTWILIGCMLLTVVQKRRVSLLFIPALVILFGLLIGTPVFSEFRYAYPMIVSLPLLIGVTLYATEQPACAQTGETGTA